MVTLIHGDDISKSRNYFTDLKSKFPDAPSIDGGDIDLTTLAQVLEGGSLFSTDKVVFIENFIFKKKNSADFKSLLSYVLNPELPARITIWEGKELDRRVVSELKNAEIKLFKLPQSLFFFLDALKPNNTERLLGLFHDTLKVSDVEQIFYMLVRHFRLLIAFGSENSNISETKRIQPWQAQKLTRQSKLFHQDKLIGLYENLYMIESGYKTGTLPSDLTTAIDIFLSGI